VARPLTAGATVLALTVAACGGDEGQDGRSGAASRVRTLRERHATLSGASLRLASRGGGVELRPPCDMRRADLVLYKLWVAGVT
jgi:hypothetical protein